MSPPYRELDLAALQEKVIEMQDQIASIVSTHRTDWSWNDVVADVKHVKAQIAAILEENQRLKNLREADLREADLQQGAGRRGRHMRINVVFAIAGFIFGIVYEVALSLTDRPILLRLSIWAVLMLLTACFGAIAYKIGQGRG